MFTGIIEATATVVQRTVQALSVTRPLQFDDLKLGSSVAVCGVCLSVIELDDRALTFNVIPTTWRKTTLGRLTAGDHVNLERALLASGRFDGHIVQGHCEGVGRIVEVEENDHPILRIEHNKNLSNYIVQHGSITLDGVSLTVAQKHDETLFSVGLIPHTLKETTFGERKIGDVLNIETDILGRYVAESAARVR